MIVSVQNQSGLDKLHVQHSKNCKQKLNFETPCGIFIQIVKQLRHPSAYLQLWPLPLNMSAFLGSSLR
jgi:hypothetical protein